ncbi:hypothetical protein Lser_V15G21918 [Lactuca serriola]
MDDHDIMAISNNGIAHETGPCEELSEVEVAHENSDIKSHENETRQSVVEEVALINNICDFKQHGKSNAITPTGNAVQPM